MALMPHSLLSIPRSLPPPPPPQRLKPSALPPNQSTRRPDRAPILRRSDFGAAATPPPSPSWSQAHLVPPSAASVPPVGRKRMRYRREYPGESKGITEEMRFVAMRLRNIDGKKYTKHEDDTSGGDDNGSTLDGGEERGGSESEESDGDKGDTWQPSVEGFVNYLVDSKLVFDTVERIVDESDDVAYAYFRKTGLERSEAISRDIEWFRQQGVVIPEPNNPGVSYAKYLEELSEKSAPMFLCHFYNIYFSHIAGGQVIEKQVSEKILDERELEFCRWEGNVQELSRGVREKLNMLGEHWSRDQKNKCLREAAKSFRFLGQIFLNLPCFERGRYIITCWRVPTSCGGLNFDPSNTVHSPNTRCITIVLVHCLRHKEHHFCYSRNQTGTINGEVILVRKLHRARYWCLFIS